MTREHEDGAGDVRRAKRRYARRPRGMGAVFKRGRTWWIRLPGHGKSESSESTRREDAERLLEQRLAEAHIGRSVPDMGRATFSDLERLVLDDMRANRRRSVANVEKNI